MLPEKNYRALKTIIERVKDHKINWAVVGSTNLCIQGVNVTPNDIDILTDKEGALLLNELLEDFAVTPVSWSETKRFKSWFGVFNIHGCKVEVMGDLHSRVPEGDLWSETAGFSARVTVSYRGLKVPAISLRREYETYLKLGRTKKAEMIARHLGAQEQD